MTSTSDDPIRLERQVRFFGDEGQAQLSAACVAVIGCGGLGSHCVQQLALLGVRDFVLVDPDAVDDTSGNRVIGLSEIQLSARAKKVTVAAELVRRIRAESSVITLPTKLTATDSLDAIATRSVVFGCLDMVSARSDLNQITSCLEVPLVDIATEIDDEGSGNWGGRSVICRGGTSCLRAWVSWTKRR